MIDYDALKQANNLFFIIELTLISLFVTYFLFVLGGPVVWGNVLKDPNVHNLIIILVMLLSVFAIVSLWCLAILFLWKRSILNKKYYIPWLGVITGIVISLASFFTDYLPRSEIYSAQWSFYTYLSMFSMGSVLIIPVAHLILSARFCKDADGLLNLLSKTKESSYY
jgi:hypothetical protein